MKGVEDEDLSKNPAFSKDMTIRVSLIPGDNPDEILFTGSVNEQESQRIIKKADFNNAGIDMSGVKFVALTTSQIGSFIWLDWWTFEPYESPNTSGYTSQKLFYSGMKPGVANYRIPSMVTAVNGDLVAAMDERVPTGDDLRTNRNINITVRRSTDCGENWSDLITAVDFEDGKSASDPSMIVDKSTGEIIMFYNYMDLDKEPDVYYLHCIKSKDNGKSWSAPEDITSQITKPEWKNDFKFITSGRGMYTRDGMLVHTLVDLKHGLHLFASKDHGKSWYLIDHALSPGDESKVIELNDGTWMVNSRVNNYDGKGPGCRHIHTTKDKGQTWNQYTETQLKDPGCNACIIRYTSTKDGYDKDRLLFSNLESHQNRKNLTVKISYDEGKTWSKGKVICPGFAAYSDMTVLPDGRIGLLYEKDNHRTNEFVTFTLDWLTNGKDHWTEAQK